MPLTDNLLSYWKFDENTGLSVLDLVGAITGTLSGVSKPGWVTGKINSGLSFNDTVGDTYVNFGNNLNQTTNSFSISFWSKIDVTGGYNILAKRSGGTGYIIYAVGNNYYFLLNSGGSAQSLSPNLTTGVYQNVVLVCNRTTNLITTYLNGSPGTPVDCSGIGSITNAGNLIIGADSNTTSSPFKGSLDEPCFWSKALTQTEITQLYNNGNGFQYPFNIPSQSMLSGNQNRNVYFNRIAYIQMMEENRKRKHK